MDADFWDGRYSQSELVWSAGPNAAVEAYCSALSPGRSLDLAAGEGRNAIWLAEQGWDSTAVDFSGVAIDKAIQIAEHRGVSITGVVADLAEYVPEAGAYDLIALIYFHVAADFWATVVGRCVDGLAPGGRLLIIGHDRSNISDGVGGPQEPSVLTTPEETSALFDDRVEIERAEVVDRMVDTDEGPKAAKDTFLSVLRNY